MATDSLSASSTCVTVLFADSSRKQPDVVYVLHTVSCVALIQQQTPSWMDCKCTEPLKLDVGLESCILAKKAQNFNLNTLRSC